MELGARHKDGTLVPGEPGPAGTVRFTVDTEWAINPKTGRPKFYGPFVFNGGTDQQSAYLRWVTKAKPREIINALKVHLETIDRQLVEAAAKAGGLLETRADTPRWGIDPNWHGLWAGRDWRVKKR
jgi:hypothetical protein